MEFAVSGINFKDSYYCADDLFFRFVKALLSLLGSGKDMAVVAIGIVNNLALDKS